MFFSEDEEDFCPGLETVETRRAQAAKETQGQSQSFGDFDSDLLRQIAKAIQVRNTLKQRRLPTGLCI